MNILDENLKAIETAGLWNLHLLTETLHLQKDGTQRPVSKLSQNPGHELQAPNNLLSFPAFRNLDRRILISRPPEKHGKTLSQKKKKKVISEKDRKVRLLAAKPNDQSSMPEPQSCPLISTHIHTMTHMHVCGSEIKPSILLMLGKHSIISLYRSFKAASYKCCLAS